MEFKFLKSSLESFTEDIDYRIDESYKFLENSYHERESLKNCLSFVDNITQATFGSSKVGFATSFFSTGEAHSELVNFISITSICLYKSSIDSLRRALEIILIGCYFNLTENDTLDGLDWLDSKKDTPYFSVTIKKLIKVGNFKKIQEIIAWNDEISKLYWELSDFSHTKGIQKSISSLNKNKNKNKSLFYTPTFSEESLILVIDLFIKVVKMIAILLTISNPILMISLPVKEKYGFSLAAGIFSKEQTIILNKILPEPYKSKLIEIIESDENIQNTIKKIEDMPDDNSYKDFIESIVNKKKK